MKRANLIRLEHSDQETVGVFLIDGKVICFTLEDADKDNAPFFSRIPEGTYKCSKVESPRFGETFEILGVVGRDLIRFHWGNTHRDTEGCPLVGTEVGWFDNEMPPVRAILNSKKAFRKFMAKLQGEDEFQLTIFSVHT